MSDGFIITALGHQCHDYTRIILTELGLLKTDVPLVWNHQAVADNNWWHNICHLETPLTSQHHTSVH